MRMGVIVTVLAGCRWEFRTSPNRLLRSVMLFASDVALTPPFLSPPTTGPQSEKNIPVAFRQIFHHVRVEMERRFPVVTADLAHIVVQEMSGHLDGTEEAFEGMR